MSNSLQFSVLYGDGSQPSPHRAKFSNLADAGNFAERMADCYAFAKLMSKEAPLVSYSYGKIIKGQKP